ncbi:GNAT family N-acetyltransferase [bacterium]|nr:GNAT family N-acetyltransferase [bacterium]
MSEENSRASLVIRPFSVADLPHILKIDHSYHTDFVWQMDRGAEENCVTFEFREIKLPRSMRVEYPWPVEQLAEEWDNRAVVLVAHVAENVAGYLTLMFGADKQLVRITNIGVLRRFRRQGIATALIRGARTWLSQQSVQQIQLEMQSKNYPYICLAYKLGFEFCGYNDRYFPNQDIALFFAKKV